MARPLFASHTRPQLVGIVNITAHSFSDGGRFLTTENALAHARRLRADGADVIELGAAASHPNAEPVTSEEEQRRLSGVIQQLVAENVPVSVDTCAAGTQRFAAACGAAYLNDIQGFPDRGRYKDLAVYSCRLIVMHSVQRIGSATKVEAVKATVKDGGGQPFSPSGGSRREVGRRFTRRHPGRALVPLTGQFWWALFCATLLLGQESLAIVPACQEYVRRFIAWRRGTTGG